mmetsp:Transcript_35559/g.111246  ORF Transcript_35559/g.111246 Transcript_35559/m.111246 type:complete len:102 (-) Transcript_35559:387-692(-)
MVFCEHVECLSSMSGSLDYIFAEIIRSYDVSSAQLLQTLVSNSVVDHWRMQGLVFMTTTQMSQLSSCLHECSTLTLEITVSCFSTFPSFAFTVRAAGARGR